MAVFLRSICQGASLESPTLGIYYRDSKPVSITPIKWPYTVNQLGNHTGKKKHMHNLIKVSRFLFKSFYIQTQYCFSSIQIIIF